MTFPNAAKLAQRYNLADLATSRIFTNSTGSKLSAWESIGYDENNNRKTELATQAQPTGTAAVAPGTGTFDYDALDRMTSFKHPFETTTATYGLDDAGNVKSEPGNTFTFVNNRLTARSVSLTENYAYGYDHFANQTTDTKKVLLQAPAVTTTSYNAASHTRRVTAPDASWVEYNYDGLQRLVSRQDSSGSTVMLFHDGLNDQIAVETDPAGTVKTRYLVDSFGVPRGKLDIGNSTGRTYYMTDPRGNVTQMIGYLDQAVKAVFAYDPYGKDKPALSKKIASSNWDSRLKFQMAPRDPKTGSYSIGSRLMNPTINRFVGADNYVAAGANLGLQVDPLTGNRYLYAGANPTGLIDDGHGPKLYKRYYGEIRAAAGAYGVEAADLAAVLQQEGSGREAFEHAFGAAFRTVERSRVGRATVGIGQMRPDLAVELAKRYGLGKFTEGEARQKLIDDNEFAVNMAALRLKSLAEDYGLTGKRAFIAYGFSPQGIRQLRANDFNPAKFPMESTRRSSLIHRSARYDEISKEIADSKHYD
jgi:RHS repeat-associated protein